MSQGRLNPTPRRKQKENVKEEVNHPDHYGGDTPYEVIKVLRHWLTHDEYIGFCKGNIHKYLARAKMKGGLKDYEKAQFYENALVNAEREGPVQ